MKPSLQNLKLRSIEAETILPSPRVDVLTIGPSSVASMTLPTVGGIPAPLDYYEESTFDLTTTGSLFAAPITVSANAVRVGRLVCITFPAITGTAAAAATLDFGVIPAQLRPARDVMFPVRIVDNGWFGSGFLHIASATGQVTVYANAQLANFSGGVGAASGSPDPLALSYYTNA